MKPTTHDPVRTSGGITNYWSRRSMAVTNQARETECELPGGTFEMLTLVMACYTDNDALRVVANAQGLYRYAAILIAENRKIMQLNPEIIEIASPIKKISTQTNY